MASAYYVGGDPDTLISELGNSRYFYGLRRTEEGDLYLFKLDQLVGNEDILQINRIGDDPSKDFTDFVFGVDFFEGRLEDHTIDTDIANLNYEQYRWDARNLFYYINSNGEFVVRINQPWPYPTDV